MDLENYIEKRVIGGKDKKEVTVVVKPLSSIEESRKMYPYRPTSKYAESRFGGDEFCDDFALFLNNLAERCSMCRAPTMKKYLDVGCCPDCDGRSEYNGFNPRVKV